MAFSHSGAWCAESPVRQASGCTCQGFYWLYQLRGGDSPLVWLTSSLIAVLGCVSGERELIDSLYSMFSAYGCGCEATSCFRASVWKHFHKHRQRWASQISQVPFSAMKFARLTITRRKRWVSCLLSYSVWWAKNNRVVWWSSETALQNHLGKGQASLLEKLWCAGLPGHTFRTTLIENFKLSFIFPFILLSRSWSQPWKEVRRSRESSKAYSSAQQRDLTMDNTAHNIVIIFLIS